MAEFCDGSESTSDAYDEVELLLRAAGHYVRPSDDLRPRVLENARAQRRERQAQRYIRHTAACVIVLTSFLAAFHSSPGAGGNLHSLGWLAGNSHDFFMPAEASALHGGDLAWQMVESFTELRRQQAQALSNSP